MAQPTEDDWVAAHQRELDALGQGAVPEGQPLDGPQPPPDAPPPRSDISGSEQFPEIAPPDLSTSPIRPPRLPRDVAIGEGARIGPQSDAAAMAPYGPDTPDTRVGKVPAWLGPGIGPKAAIGAFVGQGLLRTGEAWKEAAGATFDAVKNYNPLNPTLDADGRRTSKDWLDIVVGAGLGAVAGPYIGFSSAGRREAIVRDPQLRREYERALAQQGISATDPADEGARMAIEDKLSAAAELAAWNSGTAGGQAYGALSKGRSVAELGGVQAIALAGRGAAALGAAQLRSEARLGMPAGTSRVVEGLGVRPRDIVPGESTVNELVAQKVAAAARARQAAAPQITQPGRSGPEYRTVMGVSQPSQGGPGAWQGTVGHFAEGDTVSILNTDGTVALTGKLKLGERNSIDRNSVRVVGRDPATGAEMSQIVSSNTRAISRSAPGATPIGGTLDPLEPLREVPTVALGSGGTQGEAAVSPTNPITPHPEREMDAPTQNLWQDPNDPQTRQFMGLDPVPPTRSGGSSGQPPARPPARSGSNAPVPRAPQALTPAQVRRLQAELNAAPDLAARRAIQDGWMTTYPRASASILNHSNAIWNRRTAREAAVAREARRATLPDSTNQPHDLMLGSGPRGAAGNTYAAHIQHHATSTPERLARHMASQHGLRQFSAQGGFRSSSQPFAIDPTVRRADLARHRQSEAEMRRVHTASHGGTTGPAPRVYRMDAGSRRPAHQIPETAEGGVWTGPISGFPIGHEVTYYPHARGANDSPVTGTVVGGNGIRYTDANGNETTSWRSAGRDTVVHSTTSPGGAHLVDVRHMSDVPLADRGAARARRESERLASIDANAPGSGYGPRKPHRRAVAQAFVNNRRGTAGNLFTDGRTVWSYGQHWPLATRLPDGRYLVNVERYGSTTSQQLGIVRSAIYRSTPVGVERANIDTQGIKDWMGWRIRAKATMSRQEFARAWPKAVEKIVKESEARFAARAEQARLNRNAAGRRRTALRRQIAARAAGSITPAAAAPSTPVAPPALDLYRGWGADADAVIAEKRLMIESFAGAAAEGHFQVAAAGGNAAEFIVHLDRAHPDSSLGPLHETLGRRNAVVNTPLRLDTELGHLYDIEVTFPGGRSMRFQVWDEAVFPYAGDGLPPVDPSAPPQAGLLAGVPALPQRPIGLWAAGDYLNFRGTVYRVERASTPTTPGVGVDINDSAVVIELPHNLTAQDAIAVARLGYYGSEADIVRAMRQAITNNPAAGGHQRAVDFVVGHGVNEQLAQDILERITGGTTAPPSTLTTAAQLRVGERWVDQGGAVWEVTTLELNGTIRSVRADGSGGVMHLQPHAAVSRIVTPATTPPTTTRDVVTVRGFHNAGGENNGTIDAAGNFEVGNGGGSHALSSMRSFDITTRRPNGVVTTTSYTREPDGRWFDGSVYMSAAQLADYLRVQIGGNAQPTAITPLPRVPASSLNVGDLFTARGTTWRVLSINPGQQVIAAQATASNPGAITAQELFPWSEMVTPGPATNRVLSVGQSVTYQNPVSHSPEQGTIVDLLGHGGRITVRTTRGELLELYRTEVLANGPGRDPIVSNVTTSNLNHVLRSGDLNLTTGIFTGASGGDQNIADLTSMNGPFIGAWRRLPGAPALWFNPDDPSTAHGISDQELLMKLRLARAGATSNAPTATTRMTAGELVQRTRISGDFEFQRPVGRWFAVHSVRNVSVGEVEIVAIGGDRFTFASADELEVRAIAPYRPRMTAAAQANRVLAGTGQSTSPEPGMGWEQHERAVAEIQPMLDLGNLTPLTDTYVTGYGKAELGAKNPLLPTSLAPLVDWLHNNGRQFSISSSATTTAPLTLSGEALFGGDAAARAQMQASITTLKVRQPDGTNLILSGGGKALERVARTWTVEDTTQLLEKALPRVLATGFRPNLDAMSLGHRGELQLVGVDLTGKFLENLMTSMVRFDGELPSGTTVERIGSNGVEIIRNGTGQLNTRIAFYVHGTVNVNFQPPMMQSLTLPVADKVRVWGTIADMGIRRAQGAANLDASTKFGLAADPAGGHPGLQPGGQSLAEMMPLFENDLVDPGVRELLAYVGMTPSQYSPSPFYGTGDEAHLTRIMAPGELHGIDALQPGRLAQDFFYGPPAADGRFIAFRAVKRLDDQVILFGQVRNVPDPTTGAPMPPGEWKPMGEWHDSGYGGTRMGIFRAVRNQNSVGSRFGLVAHQILGRSRPGTSLTVEGGPRRERSHQLSVELRIKRGLEVPDVVLAYYQEKLGNYQAAYQSQGAFEIQKAAALGARSWRRSTADNLNVLRKDIADKVLYEVNMNGEWDESVIPSLIDEALPGVMIAPTEGGAIVVGLRQAWRVTMPRSKFFDAEDIPRRLVTVTPDDVTIEEVVLSREAQDTYAMAIIDRAANFLTPADRFAIGELQVSLVTERLGLDPPSGPGAQRAGSSRAEVMGRLERILTRGSMGKGAVVDAAEASDLRLWLRESGLPTELTQPLTDALDYAEVLAAQHGLTGAGVDPTRGAALKAAADGASPEQKAAWKAWGANLKAARSRVELLDRIAGVSATYSVKGMRTRQLIEKVKDARLQATDVAAARGEGVVAAHLDQALLEIRSAQTLASQRLEVDSAGLLATEAGPSISGPAHAQQLARERAAGVRSAVQAAETAGTAAVRSLVSDLAATAAEQRPGAPSAQVVADHLQTITAPPKRVMASEALRDEILSTLSDVRVLTSGFEVRWSKLTPQGQAQEWLDIWAPNGSDPLGIRPLADAIVKSTDLISTLGAVEQMNARIYDLNDGVTDGSGYPLVGEGRSTAEITAERDSKLADLARQMERANREFGVARGITEPVKDAVKATVTKLETIRSLVADLDAQDIPELGTSPYASYKGILRQLGHYTGATPQLLQEAVASAGARWVSLTDPVTHKATMEYVAANLGTNPAELSAALKARGMNKGEITGLVAAAQLALENQAAVIGKTVALNGRASDAFAAEYAKFVDLTFQVSEGTSEVARAMNIQGLMKRRAMVEDIERRRGLAKIEAALAADKVAADAALRAEDKAQAALEALQLQRARMDAVTYAEAAIAAEKSLAQARMMSEAAAAALTKLATERDLLKASLDARLELERAKFIAKAVKEGVRPEYVSRLAAFGDDLQGMMGFLATVKPMSPGQMIVSGYMSNILTGVKTITTNVTTSSLWLAKQQAEHIVQVALVEPALAALYGRQRVAYIEEMLPEIMGTIQGIPMGVAKALQVVRDGTHVSLSNADLASAMAGGRQRGIRPSLAGRGFKLVPFWNDSPRIGDAFDMGGRFSVAADALVRWPKREGLTVRLAYREAKRRLAAAGIDHPSRQEWADAAAELGMDTAWKASIEEQLQTEAAKPAFANPGHAFTQKFAALRATEANLGPLGPTPVGVLYFPFVNIADVLISNGLLIATSPARVAIGIPATVVNAIRSRAGQVPPQTEEEALHQSETISRDIVNFVLAASAISALLILKENGQITGSSPIDRQKYDEWRADDPGKMPYAVKLNVGGSGDKWYEWGRLEPFVFPLKWLLSAVSGWEATAQDAARKGEPNDPRAIAGDAAWEMVGRLAKSLSDLSYLRSISLLLDAIVNGVQAGEHSAQVLLAPLTGFVPGAGLVGNFARNADPYQRGTGTDPVKRIQAQTPGLQGNVMPSQTLWGNPIPQPNELAGAFTPVRVSTAHPDPVVKKLEEVRGHVPTLRYVQQVTDKPGGVELDDAQVYRWKEIAGMLTKQNLEDLFASVGFEQKTWEQKAKAISTAISVGRGQAKEQYATELFGVVGGKPVQTSTSEQEKALSLFLSTSDSSFRRAMILDKWLPKLDSEPAFALELGRQMATESVDGGKVPITLDTYRKAIPLLKWADAQPEYADFSGKPIGDPAIWASVRAAGKEWRALGGSRFDPEKGATYLTNHPQLIEYLRLASRNGGKNPLLTAVREGRINPLGGPLEDGGLLKRFTLPTDAE